MKVELRDITTIQPYPGNPRVNDQAVDAVAHSIRQFGFRQPIVVDAEGVIVCGHTRYKAALKLALAQVPVHVALDLTPEQVKAYRIADNKSADLATWDLELLPIELADLKAMDIDLGALGFTVDELAKLLDPGVKDGLTDPDAVPEPPDEAVTRRGDLWVLGDHRLLCGDSASAADVDLLLEGAPIHLVNSDPPYNVKVEPRSHNAIAAGNSSFQEASSGAAAPGKMRAKDRPLENDFVSDEAFAGLLKAWFGNFARVLLPGRGFYIWGGYSNLGNYPGALKEAGLYFSQAIVWDKQHPVLTRKDYMGSFELCQPPDTKVHTPDGVSAISALRDGDEVVTYAQSSCAIVGHRKGPKIKIGSRDYYGPLYGITTGSKTTWCTDGHIFAVRLAEHVRNVSCVYLMRRGRWWRVGKCKILTTWGLGVKQRLDKEGGEEAWILSVHQSNTEATCVEQIVAAKYGIPTTFWTENQTSTRTEEQIRRMYGEIDPMALHRGALWALSDHHRRLEYPFIVQSNTRPKYGRRVSFKVRACNILPGVMQIPLPKMDGPRYEWAPISHVDVQQYNGKVYSMDVEKYHHYIADGIVTHNCFYGWRQGAAHVFLGPNNATDLWHLCRYRHKCHYADFRIMPRRGLEAVLLVGPLSGIAA